MKNKIKVRILSLILAVTMILGIVPDMALNVYATENTGTSLDTSSLEFDVSDPAGYVTISFTDNGVRTEDATINNEELYGTALGAIIADTKVPFEEGESVADVTVRLFKAMDLAYEHTGSVDKGFYLSKIKDFELNGIYYPELGEFNAGGESGWCVRLNNWHINQSSSAFEVEDGDTISWLYTCQYGADVGADFSNKSAEIKDIILTDSSLALAESAEEGIDYTCIVPEDFNNIAFEVELENYASVVTVAVDGNEVKYRPNKAISVNKNSTIVISTELEYMDADNNNEITTYTDSVTIQLCQENQEPENSAPTVVENAPTSLSATVSEEISVDLSSFFTDVDGDPLTYNVKIAALNLDQTLEGSIFTGTIPAAGTYEVIITASDDEASVSHTVALTVAEKGNSAPNIKAEYAETNSKTYVYSSSYVYIYMDDIFEDADGDTLTYKATCNGEEVDISYNSWSKQYSIQFAEKPVVKEYKIVANDGKADSEVFTAKCIGTTATITASEDSSLIPSGTYYYYVKGSEENDTFALNYTLDVDESLVTEWTSSNANVLKSNGDGTFTIGDNVTSRQSLYVGVTCGKDQWNSPLYLGTKNFYILAAVPEFKSITAPLAEHADNVKATVESSAVTGGWYTSEFNYAVKDPTICDITTSGTYGLSVTPKALGTTTVTATFKYDDSIKCTFDVTVTGRSLQLKDQPGIDSVDFKEGKTVQLEVLGAEEGETFTWTSADESVATVDANGLVTIKALGQTYITAVSSLSTEETTLKASMYLQVKEAGKVYLDDLALTQYSYFGHISAKAGFNSAQLTYDWDLAENRYSYSTLQFTPYFDNETLDAVLHYQVSGGEYQTMALENSKAVSITNGLNPGENIVKIDVYEADDAENITTYTFNIFRPYNPANTISRMTIYPNGETALAYPTYLDYKEGTIFQWDTEKDDFVTGWNGKPATGWTSSGDTFKTFVYGARTSSISVYPTFAYAGQRVMMYVDGKEFEEAVTNWKSKIIPVDEDGTVIKFHVNSEKYHAEKVAAGIDDPFAEPEKIYTLYIENVEPLGIDAEILSAELDGGEFYKPGFSSKSYTISALIPADQNSANLTFTVPAGIDVYKTSVSDANKLTSTEKDEKGNNVYTTETVKITGTGMYAYSKTSIILQVTDEEGNVGKTQYDFTVSKRGAKDIYPDSIVEYLCIGSQYTNAGSYGTMPERTLKEGGGTLSLGNFGGYIVYKYDTPIENNPKNPYGVDFVIYGNSFGNGGHEPGYVQVSKDGETWYTLAGSEHFDDHNDWNFSMTYTNNNGKSAWTNSDGESGEIYNYPASSSYPYFTWTKESEASMTVSGPRLNSSAKDAYGSAAAVLPVFGYVDVNTNGTINGTSNNPYNHPGTLVAGGDMFDLDWAVNEDGMPVDIDSVSYIRVATASSIYAGAIGEKSTEVTAVNRVTNTAEEAVGKTEAVEIKVNDKVYELSEGEDVITVLYNAEEAVTIDVAAAEGVNVYINNAYGASRTYETAPEKGIVRIIVQEGEKEPYIVYLCLKNEIDTETVSAEKIYAETGNYLKKQSAKYPPTVNTIGGEWLVIGLARSGQGVPEGYYENVLDYVAEEINDKEQLHTDKSTDNARVILALTAAGYDITNVIGHNLLEGLTDMDYVKYQGINGPIWALIALNSYNYTLPEADSDVKNPVTEEGLVEYILRQQTENGNWVLSPKLSKYDTDMTAMAIQALAPYYETNNEVKAAIDKALTSLSEKNQMKDGGFASYGTPNSESCSQVLVALTSLGIDPLKDTRFIKNGNTVLDALCTYYVEGGGFKHTNGTDEEFDGMATEQGYYALASYFRMKNDQTSLYDMTDVTMKDMADVVEDMIKEIGTVTADSEKAISYARATFDGLSAEDQKDVANYSVLQASETTYAAIKEKIENVKELIDEIGTVKYDKTTEDKIEAARAAYDKLTAEEKKHIGNYATLTAAEKKYTQLENANEVMDLIDKIGTVTKDSEDEIEAARKAYDALTKEEKALVDNYSTLTKAERELKALLEPEGETKVIGDGETEVKIGNVTYMVDEEAAKLMEKIEALAASANPAADDIIALYKEYDAMSAELKAQVFNYDDLEALTNKLGVGNHKDEAIGLEADGLEWYIQLVVDDVTSGTEYDNFANSIGNNTLIKLWDIYLVNLLTGETYHPVQKLTLKVGNIDVSEYEEIRIAHLTEAGQMEYFDCTITDGYLTWETDSLSLFGLIGGEGEAEAVLEEEPVEEETVEEPKEEIATAPAEEVENAGIPWIWILLAALGIAALAVVIALKKKSSSGSME